MLEIEWDMLISFKMKQTIHNFFKPTRSYETITESVMDKCSN
jgi:hypothetical protein